MIDRTKEWAPQVADFIRREPALTALRVHSLSRLARSYDAADFRSLAKIIDGKSIEMYEVRDDVRFTAMYVSDPEGDHFVFDTANLRDGPLSARGTLVHELTHMIQDKKRMSQTEAEREMDAYLVESVYRARAGSRAGPIEKDSMLPKLKKLREAGEAIATGEIGCLGPPESARKAIADEFLGVLLEYKRLRQPELTKTDLEKLKRERLDGIHR